MLSCLTTRVPLLKLTWLSFYLIIKYVNKIKAREILWLVKYLLQTWGNLRTQGINVRTGGTLELTSLPT